jgi:hypothetical protein
VPTSPSTSGAVAPIGDVVGPTKPRASEEPREPWRGLAVSLGVSGELWSSRVVGALGPNARVEVAVKSHLALEAGGALLFTPLAPGGVSGRVVRLRAGAVYVVDDARRFRLGAFGFVDLLHATPDVSLHTESVNHTVPGLGIHVDYALSEAPIRIVTGPTVTGRLGAVRVEVGSHEAFNVPAVAVGWTLEGLFGPF